MSNKETAFVTLDDEELDAASGGRRLTTVSVVPGIGGYGGYGYGYGGAASPYLYGGGGYGAYGGGYGAGMYSPYGGFGMGGGYGAYGGAYGGYGYGFPGYRLGTAL